MLDAHLHFSQTLHPDRFDTVLSQNGIDAAALMCIPQEGVYSTVPDALKHKLRRAPASTYVCGGLERSAYVLYQNEPAKLADSLVRQAELLLEMGCDGVKLLEGKPDIRRTFPIPDFDTEAWEPFWALMEQKSVPVVMHLNDPPEFWDESKINPYAKSEGWFYGPESINNEEQYRQMDQVLRRHPLLKLQLAHFYFLYGQLPRMRALLRQYPNVRIDLTPGIEIYTSLACQTEDARRFFAEFASRILFGSDIGSRATIAQPPREIDFEESSARIRVIRAFLEGTQPYTLIPDGKYLFRIDPTPMQPLGLSRGALDGIYGGNARAMYAAQPKPVNVSKTQAWCEEASRGLERLSRLSAYAEVSPSRIREKAQWFEEE